MHNGEEEEEEGSYQHCRAAGLHPQPRGTWGEEGRQCSPHAAG